MDKDEILKMSRKENEGRRDERETAALGNAARVGMFVGAFVCVILVFAGELLFHMPKLGLIGWLVYFAMQGSSNIALFMELNARRDLVRGSLRLPLLSHLP